MAASKSCAVIITMLSLTFSFFVITLAFSIVANNSLAASTFEFIQSMGESWNQGVLTDIISNTDKGCQAGYENFIIEQWPGTTSGCLCINLTRGFCNRSRNSYQRYCKDVYPIKAQPLVQWDQRTICVKRGTNYLNLQTASGTCPSTYPKKRGVADTLGNIVCVKSNETCPINEIRFLGLNDPLPSTGATYTTRTLKDRKFIFSNDNPNGLLPSLSKISDLQPCLNPKYFNYYNGKAYILDNNYGRHICPGGEVNKEWKILDSIDYKALLWDNQVYNLLSKLPKYPFQILNHKSNLYIKGFIGIKSDCKGIILENHNYNAAFFNDNIISIGATVKNSTGLAVGAMICAIIGLFGVTAFLIVGIIVACSAEFGKHGCLKFAMIITFLITAIMILISFSLAGAVASKLSNLGKSHLALKGCLTDDSNKLLLIFIENVAKGLIFSVMTSIFGAITLLFSLGVLISWLTAKNDGGSSDYGNEPVGYPEVNVYPNAREQEMNNYVANVDVNVNHPQPDYYSQSNQLYNNNYNNNQVQNIDVNAPVGYNFSGNVNDQGPPMTVGVNINMNNDAEEKPEKLAMIDG